MAASCNLKRQMIRLLSLAAPPLCYLLLLSRWDDLILKFSLSSFDQIQPEDNICKSRVSRTHLESRSLEVVSSFAAAANNNGRLRARWLLGRSLPTSWFWVQSNSTHTHTQIKNTRHTNTQRLKIHVTHTFTQMLKHLAMQVRSSGISDSFHLSSWRKKTTDGWRLVALCVHFLDMCYFWQILHKHFIFSRIPTCSTPMLQHFACNITAHNCSGLDRSDAVGGGGGGEEGGGGGGGEGAGRKCQI